MQDFKKSIALVGRPNVGKSRLFNRMLGRRVSIVHDMPGVTRDIVIEDLSDDILLMDTGGMGATPQMTEAIIAQATNFQAKFAIDTADLVIFVVDAQEGFNALDDEIATLLRQSGKKIILAINKVDLPKHSQKNPEFYRMGFDTVEISAEHGAGMDELNALLEDNFGIIEKPQPKDETRINICVAGRPNVGKSSIANRLLGEERLIVSQIAGTTRDSVKFDIDTSAKNSELMKFTLYDTAGLKTKRKINTSLDFLSSLRTRTAIEKSDVVFLIMDAIEGVSELDKKLANQIIGVGASIIILVNKWDYATETFAREPLKGYNDIKDFNKKFEEALRKEFPFLADSPLLFVSAKHNKGINRLLPAANKLYKKMHTPITTGKLNSTVEKIIEKNPPKYISGKKFKVYYSLKIASRPFTFRMYCNNPKVLNLTYKRYMENELRRAFELGGISIKLEFVGKKTQTLHERLRSRSKSRK